MLRMAAERFWPRRNPLLPDETLGGFFRRRFGTEAFDYLIEPLVAGIYAGDADELSMSVHLSSILRIRTRIRQCH